MPCAAQAFDTVDEDKSGTIDRAELEKAIRKMDPNCSSATVNDMINFADDDGDGKCVPPPPPPPLPAAATRTPARAAAGSDWARSWPTARAAAVGRVSFEEFKKIMLYKPSAA